MPNVRHVLIAVLLLLSWATVRAQSITSDYTLPFTITSSGIQGSVRYQFLPARPDSSRTLVLPSTISLTKFSATPTVTISEDTIAWLADSTSETPDGLHHNERRSLTFVVDTIQHRISEIALSTIVNEFQQSYQTNSMLQWRFYGDFPYTLSDTALQGVILGQSSSGRLDSIAYSSQDVSLVQGQLSSTTANGLYSLQLDNDAALSFRLPNIDFARVLITHGSSQDVSPNPASSYVDIPSRSQLTVSNAAGLRMEVASNFSGADKQRLTLTPLPAGVYFVTDGSRSWSFTVLR